VRSRCDTNFCLFSTIAPVAKLDESQQREWLAIAVTEIQITTPTVERIVAFIRAAGVKPV
jgi:hypothetical protein